MLATWLVAGWLAGCGTSAWSDTYVGTRDPAAAQRSQTSPVQVRSVPWQRIEATLTELQKEIAASDVHPDEWTVEQKDAAKAKLLQGLQVSTPPDQVDIMGRSEFRTTDSIRPETPKGEAELVAFARQIGAEAVVWSARYYGKVERVVKEPVTTYSSGTDWHYHDGRNRPTSFSDSSTTWVPVRVQMDELGYIAYFLRSKR